MRILVRRLDYELFELMECSSKCCSYLVPNEQLARPWDHNNKNRTGNYQQSRVFVTVLVQSM
jgi:hypothetical protein